MPKLRKKGVRAVRVRNHYFGKLGLDAIGRAQLNTDKKLDFKGDALTNLDLRLRRFPGTDFSGSRIRNVDLRYADLSGSNFSRSWILDSKLDEANLSNTDFSGARILRTTLYGANISDSIFVPKKIYPQSRYSGRASLTWGTPQKLSDKIRIVNGYMIYEGANLRYAGFYNQDLSGVRFIRCDLSYAKLDGAKLAGAVFDKCVLQGTSIKGADLGQAKFTFCRGKTTGVPMSFPPQLRLVQGHILGPYCEMRGLSLVNADLSFLDLRRARAVLLTLRNPNLEGTKLPKEMRSCQVSEIRGTPSVLPAKCAIVKGIILGPNMRADSVDLSNTDLGRLNLTGSSAQYTNVDGADFSRCALSKSNWNLLKGTPKALPKGWEFVRERYAELDSGAPDKFREYPGTIQKIGSAEAAKEHYDIRDPGDNERFKAWFKTSKAAIDGRPVVVYHGSRQNYSAFRPERKGRGYFFTNDIRVANTYLGRSGDIPDPIESFSADEAAETDPDKQPKGSRGGIFRSYLSMQNPYIYNGNGEQWSALRDPNFPRAKTTDDIARAARKAGHDGVIFRNIMDTSGSTKWDNIADVYVVYEPAQIKSALFNEGTYDPTNPDMRKNPRRSSRRPKRRMSRTSRHPVRRTSRGRKTSRS